ncbi:lethal(2) giant larvae protein-like protein [Corchorus olitorius]|uniref:Lethal(2) giant larvae protein-like protein n=1 Tax=Corchorus olitorius TaxID=93759 RepID=A0A1R3IAN8_9ROSI|nr:lethal(2) giant larvae protein-like protein [Corchorus olitorius]
MRHKYLDEINIGGMTRKPKGSRGKLLVRVGVSQRRKPKPVCPEAVGVGYGRETSISYGAQPSLVEMNIRAQEKMDTCCWQWQGPNALY